MAMTKLGWRVSDSSWRTRSTTSSSDTQGPSSRAEGKSVSDWNESKPSSGYTTSRLQYHWWNGWTATVR